MKGAKRLVMVGDHRQLPPVVQSQAANEAGLGHSLFERLLDEGAPSAMLQVGVRVCVWEGGGGGAANALCKVAHFGLFLFERLLDEGAPSATLQVPGAGLLVLGCCGGYYVDMTCSTCQLCFRCNNMQHLIHNRLIHVQAQVSFT